MLKQIFILGALTAGVSCIPNAALPPGPVSERSMVTSPADTLQRKSVCSSVLVLGADRAFLVGYVSDDGRKNQNGDSHKDSQGQPIHLLRDIEVSSEHVPNASSFTRDVISPDSQNAFSSSTPTPISPPTSESLKPFLHPWVLICNTDWATHMCAREPYKYTCNVNAVLVRFGDDHSVCDQRCRCYDVQGGLWGRPQSGSTYCASIGDPAVCSLPNIPSWAPQTNGRPPKPPGHPRPPFPPKPPFPPRGPYPGDETAGGAEIHA